MVTITIPKKMSEDIQAFIDEGYYDNRSELFRDAIRTFLDYKSKERLCIAINKYRKEDMTISRAAEIAGIPFEQMKSILIEEGIIRRGRGEDNTKRKDIKELEELIS
tara:strand:+ start:62 stop:382 length:321 start_codon:yes stop_codon:yes gene_type:complete